MLKLTTAQLWARSYASWQARGSIVIRVSSLVVDGIYTEKVKGFDASGDHIEVGGILLGKIEGHEIIVDDFEPVPCEHRFGASFRLSDGDRIGWRETLQRIPQHEEFAIIGCYRTDTGQEFARSEDDRELLETELQQDGGVFLLLKPSQSQPYEAKLFLRDEGQLREALQKTYFACDSRAASLLPSASAERPRAVEPTERAEAPLSRIQDQLSNPGRDSEFFDPGNNSLAREITPAAFVTHSPQSPSVGRTAAREFEPKDSVQTPRVESEPEHAPGTLSASEDEEATAADAHGAEFLCVPDPRVCQPPEASEFRQEAIRPLARRRFLAQKPPLERKARKLSFAVGAALLAAVGGTLGYYSVRPRLTAPASTQSPVQAPVPAGASQMASAPQPAQSSPVQPAQTESSVPPRKATEDKPDAAATDQQVRLFLHKWADAERSANLGEIEDYYAPKLNRYLTKRDVTRASVRAARAQVAATYGRTIVCNIKDISVNPLDSDHAVARFRKRWQTAGPRVLMGEEQEELTLIRDQGEWQISAEQRTKLYWERKEHYAPASR